MNSAADTPAPRFVALALVVATVLLYLPVRGFDYVAYDDHDYVVNNGRVLAGLTWDGVAWAFASGHASNWHPLTWLSHMLDAELFGPGPAGPHLVNVAFHAANTALLFGVLLLYFPGAVRRSAWVAALFALHPLRVESVAWVAERKDVLSAFFFLLALGAYAVGLRARASQIPNLGSRAPLLPALAFFALGLMSKPMLVTLPCVLLLLDLWPLGRLSAASPRALLAGLPPLLREKIPFFALAAASCVVTFLVQRDGGAVQGLGAFTPGERVANAFVACALYLRNTFWPAGLAVFYPHPGRWPAPAVAASALLVAALCVAAVRAARIHPFITTGWFWFLGMLVPVIGLVQVGGQSHADRYAYLPHVGLFVALAWGAAALARRWRAPPAALAVAAVLPLLACAVATRAQLHHWRDTETLFTRAVAVTNNNALAHNNLGNALAARGALDDGVSHLRRALALRPDYPDAHSNLGDALLQQGDLPGAAVHFRRAVELDPDFPEPRYNLGNLALESGDFAEAVGHFEKALATRPDFAMASNNLGNALLRLGRAAEAVARFEHALALRPDFVAARHNLGSVLHQLGRSEEALAHYRKIVELQPANANAHNNLGWLLRQLGRAEEAVSATREAVRLRPGYAEAHDNLAKALLAAGRVEEALEHCRTSLRLQPDDPITLATLASIQARINQPAPPSP